MLRKCYHAVLARVNDLSPTLHIAAVVQSSYEASVVHDLHRRPLAFQSRDLHARRRPKFEQITRAFFLLGWRHPSHARRLERRMQELYERCMQAIRNAYECRMAALHDQLL